MAATYDSLEIPVTYRGEELCFQAKFLLTGYTHNIQVAVNDQLIILS